MRLNIARTFLILIAMTMTGCGDWTGFGKSVNIEVLVEVVEDDKTYSGTSVWRFHTGLAPAFLLSTHSPNLSFSLQYEAIPILLSGGRIIFVSGFGGESSFSLGQIERKKYRETYKKYVKRVLKHRDWVNVKPEADREAKAFLICFSEDLEYGTVDLMRVKNEQDICGHSILVTKFQWRITEKPCVLGRLDETIGRNVLADWEKQIVADNKERLRDINNNRLTPENRRNFDRELRFREAFRKLSYGRDGLEACK